MQQFLVAYQLKGRMITILRYLSYSPVIFKGNMIRPGGALVLGQEQDSVGGRFDASQSFIGELTDVNIWDHVIKEQEIKRMSKSCLTGVGNLFQWPDFKSHIKGSVKIIEPSC